MVAKSGKKIPAIKETSLLGSIKAMQTDRLGLFKRIGDECGDIGSFRFAFLKVIMVNSPQLIHNFLVEHADDFEQGITQHFMFRPLVGNGLLNLEGKRHQQERKLIAPAFQHRRVTSYADTMTKYAENIQQKWQPDAKLNLNEAMAQLTMQIASKTLFDSDILDNLDELSQAITAGVQLVEYRGTHVFAAPMFVPTARNRRAKQAQIIIRSKIQPLIDERRASGVDKGDFLSMLMLSKDEEGQSLSDTQVRDEAVTLFLAGHETTANALTWAFYLLAQHPEIYAKLQNEVDTVLQGRTPTYADLAKLPYTLQVFKEAIRMYPPASAILRVALRPVELDGYQIGRLQSVMVSPYVLHRRPEFYPDPERFDPERFSPANEKKLPRYAYLPFGAGPRVCIGNQFAQMEAHLVMAVLTQYLTFELEPGQNIYPKPILTLRTNQNVKVTVRRRTPDFSKEKATEEISV